jgi:hypothetical protein
MADVLEVQDLLSNHSHFLQKATECNEFQYGRAAMCFLGAFANLKLSTRRHLQAGRWNILGTISHLFSGTERHSSLQELPSTATDHAQDA